MYATLYDSGFSALQTGIRSVFGDDRMVYFPLGMQANASLCSRVAISAETVLIDIHLSSIHGVRVRTPVSLHHVKKKKIVETVIYLYNVIG